MPHCLPERNLNMYVNLSFKSEDDFVLPIHYNHILQGFIYSAIDPALAAMLHDQGFMVNNRSFKLFVYSRLFGEYKIDSEKQQINFGNVCRFSLASPIEAFCISICHTLLVGRRHHILGGTRIDEVEVEVGEPFEVGESTMVYTKSPIVAYSTLLRPSGAKYTCYFQPGEEDFNRIITENLQKKYVAVYGKQFPEGEVTLQPLQQPRLNIVSYKGTVIKGYSGKFRLSGPKELLQLALDAGLGSKNAQGFGFIQLMVRR